MSAWTKSNELIAAALKAADELEQLGQDGTALRQAGFALLRALGPPAADWAEPHLRALWDGAHDRVRDDWNVVYDMTHRIGHLQQALVYLAERNRPDRPGVHTDEAVMRRHLELALQPVARRPVPE